MHIRAWKNHENIEITSGDDPNFSDGPHIQIPVEKVDSFIETLQRAREFARGETVYCSFKVEGV